VSARIDVLVPTCDRPQALAVTLTSLAAQTLREFRVVVADQSSGLPAYDAPEVRTPVRVLEAGGVEVVRLRNLPRRGLAQQRQFLLDAATAPRALFLDDDVLCGPAVLARLDAALDKEQCGFVGMPLIGLSHRDDVRPHEQRLERWDGPVRPEVVRPGTPEWGRHVLHNAANVWHVQRGLELGEDDLLTYKVAWVGGCVLYDVAKLRAVGGFGFWRELPAQHAGEDVLAQLRVMARFGGCGVLPSAAYHQQLPTTVDDRRCDAPYVLAVDR
jgi:GT2 family glycosyltransferase